MDAEVHTLTAEEIRRAMAADVEAKRAAAHRQVDELFDAFLREQAAQVEALPYYAAGGDLH